VIGMTRMTWLRRFAATGSAWGFQGCGGGTFTWQSGQSRL